MTSARVGDLELHYDEFGDASDPPLLLLHGAAAITSDPVGGWAALIPSLGLHHRVVAVDHRGHGRTANPAGYMTFEQIADDMEALLDRLGINSCHVAGISDGGVVALAMAIRPTDTVRSVVVVGANHTVDDQILAQIPMLDAERIEREHPVAAAALADRHDRGRYPGYWRDLLEQILDNNIRNPDWSSADLSTIRCPVLLIAGEHDPFANMEQMIVMRRSIPRSEWLIINDTGHAAHYERPDIVGPRMIDFLRRHTIETR